MRVSFFIPASLVIKSRLSIQKYYRSQHREPKKLVQWDLAASVGERMSSFDATMIMTMLPYTVSEIKIALPCFSVIFEKTI